MIVFVDHGLEILQKQYAFKIHTSGIIGATGIKASTATATVRAKRIKTCKKVLKYFSMHSLV